jgi:cytochrome c556
MSQSSSTNQLKAALAQLNEAVQNLANFLDENDLSLSAAAPEYMADMDDFAYEVASFVEDEIIELDQEENVNEQQHAAISA